MTEIELDQSGSTRGDAWPSVDSESGTVPSDRTDGGDASASALTSPASPNDDSPPVLEMRQIAGLTAGSVMPLSAGQSYEFTESMHGESFGLRVLDSGEAIVVAGTATAVINEVEVVEPTFLGHGILNVGSACFAVRRPRRADSNDSRLAALEAAHASPSAISVPTFDDVRAIPTPGKESQHGSLLADGPGQDNLLSAQSWEFLHKIRNTRDVVAERHRLTHPDPEELKNRLTRLEPGLWERRVSHPLFGRFSVAYATIPWEPHFDHPELIPVELHKPILSMSLLPWIPITANLMRGPLGIVGSRAATLACSRHAIVSLAALSAPGEVRFSVVTDRGDITDWEWTTALPTSMSPEGDGEYMVAVVDGMEHFGKVGIDYHRIRSEEIGLVVLARSMDELPDNCSTILELNPEGTATITNHLKESIPGTPIGVTQAFALDMATRIADIVAGVPY